MIYPAVEEILNKEIDRQNNTIELIASENFASQAVKDLCEVYLQISMLKVIPVKDTIMVVITWMRLKT